MSKENDAFAQAWAMLPDALTAHPGLKALKRAHEAAPGLVAPAPADDLNTQRLCEAKNWIDYAIAVLADGRIEWAKTALPKALAPITEGIRAALSAQASIAAPTEPRPGTAAEGAARQLDPNKIQLCRMGKHGADALQMGQPCNCPEGSCRLWNGGLKPAAAEGAEPDCTNADRWNCKYCHKTEQCEAINATGGVPVSAYDRLQTLADGQAKRIMALEEAAARNPLTDEQIEDIFCDKLDASRAGMLECTDLYNKCQWFRRGFIAATGNFS